MNIFTKVKLLIGLNSRWNKIEPEIQAIRKDYPMLTLGQILKSRTVWSLLLITLINGIQSIQLDLNAIDPHIFTALNGILLGLAFLFRINPKQGA